KLNGKILISATNGSMKVLLNLQGSDRNCCAWRFAPCSSLFAAPASCRTREKPEQRNNKIDAKVRLKVCMRLAAAGRQYGLCVESRGRYIAKEKIQRLRFSHHIARRIGAGGQICGGNEGMTVNRNLLRCQRNGFHAPGLS